MTEEQNKLAELLPCPFCGSPAEQIDNFDRQGDCQIMCHYCHASIKRRGYDGATAALVAWNSRAEREPGSFEPQEEMDRVQLLALIQNLRKQLTKRQPEREPATEAVLPRVPICGTAGPTVSRAIWDEAMIAHQKQYGKDQRQFERLLREGFYAEELDQLRPSWRPVEQRIADLEAALKGKGASQGASNAAAPLEQIIDGVVHRSQKQVLPPMTAAPEPSGEFVRVPRGLAIELRAHVAMQFQGIDKPAPSSALVRLDELLAPPPMSRRDEDAKR